MIMKKILYIFIPLAFIVGSVPLTVKAAGKCFCSSNLSGFKVEEATKYNAGCFAATTDQECKDNKSQLASFVGVGCEMKADDAACTADLASWTVKKTQLGVGAVEKEVQKGQGFQGNIMPDCVLNDTIEVSPECRDVSIFVVTLINLARYLFSIIGGLALLMFIYGGFLMILSRGNSDQVKKGTGAMVAAVVGLVIAFSGYVLIKFLGDVMGVSTF